MLRLYMYIYIVRIVIIQVYNSSRRGSCPRPRQTSRIFPSQKIESTYFNICANTSPVRLILFVHLTSQFSDIA